MLPEDARTSIKDFKQEKCKHKELCCPLIDHALKYYTVVGWLEFWNLDTLLGWSEFKMFVHSACDPNYVSKICL